MILNAWHCPNDNTGQTKNVLVSHPMSHVWDLTGVNYISQSRHISTPIRMLMADGTSFLYKKLVRMRILVQEVCPCVISSCMSFFSYEKLRWIRTMFYSVRETWSHVIEMLRHYWLEVRFVFFTIIRCWWLLAVSYFSSFWPFCWLWIAIRKKNKIWNSL